MGNGYIQLHRSMLDWEWYSDINTKTVFIHLLLTANHADASWQGVDIKAGQTITSSDKIAEQTGMTRQNVRTALNHLKSTNEITIQSTNKFSLITLQRWAFYQNPQDESTSKLTNKSTIDQPATNQQLTTNNKKNKNNKNSYGECDNVNLTDEEYEKLIAKFGIDDTGKRIDRLSMYIASKGDKYKSHYATILQWAQKENEQQVVSSAPVTSGNRIQNLWEIAK